MCLPSAGAGRRGGGGRREVPATNPIGGRGPRAHQSGPRTRPEPAPTGEVRMTPERSPDGRITISSRAIAPIASRAALGTYGVVGMSSRNFADGIAQMLVHDPHRGIEVHAGADQIRIDAYIIVEYG